jgi:Protein of unknown function DUF262
MAEAQDTQIREEYFLDEPMGVEVETDDDAVDLDRPWRPEEIRVATSSFSVRNVLDMIDDNELELAPGFQRNKVWSRTTRSRLIESILLKIPLPAFYFAQDNDGTMKVVDGLQRLSTVHSFAREEGFVLHGLEYLSGEEGKRFDELPALWQRRFHQTQLIAHVIDPTTPSQVKYDIFKRINTGGTPLNTQEIRHALSGQRSRDFLRRCAESQEFITAVGDRFRDHIRMADREMVLRFCAFRMLGPENYQRAMDPFLDNANSRLDDPRQVSDRELEGLAKDFMTAMRLGHAIFGLNAFRKVSPDQLGRSPVNRALFESWSVTLAEAASERLNINYEDVRDEAYELMSIDYRYIDSITTSTGDPRKVRYRFAKAREVLGLS